MKAPAAGPATKSSTPRQPRERVVERGLNGGGGVERRGRLLVLLFLFLLCLSGACFVSTGLFRGACALGVVVVPKMSCLSRPDGARLLALRRALYFVVSPLPVSGPPLVRVPGAPAAFVSSLSCPKEALAHTRRIRTGNLIEALRERDHHGRSCVPCLHLPRAAAGHPHTSYVTARVGGRHPQRGPTTCTTTT